MAVEWSRLCKAKDLTVDGAHVDVGFGDGRRHRVTVTELEDAYLLSGVVAARSAIADSLGLVPQVWLRNRATALVGFRIDQRGRLVGEAWVPEPGITADEFQLYVRT